MLLHRWILALQIATLPAICLEIKNVETRTSQLFLAEDGKLLDLNNLPNCGPEKKIILKSYTYNQMKCTSASCTSVHEDKMAESTALQLHQNCSLRQSCETLHFPAPISLPNRPDNLLAVTIQYQCTHDQRSILNMCERHKMNFTDTLHLTFNSHTKNSENCICGVNEGPLSLTIEDLRMKSWNDDMCSAANFVINGHQFTCDPESDSYGAIFGKTIQDTMPLGAHIELAPNSDSKLPEMIWITVTPEVSSRLVCYGDHVSSEKSTSMVKDTTKQGLTTKYVADVVDTSESLHKIVTTTECYGDHVSSEKSTSMVKDTTKQGLTKYVADVVATSESLHKIVTTTDGSFMDGREGVILFGILCTLVLVTVLVAILTIAKFYDICTRIRIQRTPLKKSTNVVVRQPSDSKPDNTPGTSYFERKLLRDVRRQSKVITGKEETETNTNTDDELTDCTQPLVQDKPTQSRQKSLPKRTDVEETLCMNKNVPKTILVDIHRASSNDSEKILLSDESVRYMNENTDEPVQESGQNGKVTRE